MTATEQTYMSQTLLSKANACPHSAYLYRRHRDLDVQSVQRAFGSVFHLFAEVAMRELIATGEATLYAAQEGEDLLYARQQVASLTAAMVDEILREHPELPVPIRHGSHSVDHLRQCAYHWAVGYDVKPDQVLGLEQTYELDVAGITIRGRIDVVALLSSDTIGVDDYKSSYAMPDQAGFEEKLQVPLYCCLVAFGNPVDDAGERLPSVAAGANWFRGREVYPRYLLDTDELGSRGGDDPFSRTELADFLHDLERLIDQTRDRFEKWAAFEEEAGGVEVESEAQAEELRAMEAVSLGECFPAVPGPHCSQCPAQAECPLPKKLRDYQGAITDMEQASAVMRSVDRTEAIMRTLKADCRRFASEHGAIPLGPGKAYGFKSVESWKVKDWVALELAVHDGANFGKPFDLGEFRKRSASMRFVQLDVEDAPEAEPVDVEAARDEKFGEAAPF